MTFLQLVALEMHNNRSNSTKYLAHGVKPHVASALGHSHGNTAENEDFSMYEHLPRQSLVSFVFRFLVCLSVVSVLVFYPYTTAETDRYSKNVWGVKAQHLADSITPKVRSNEFPQNVGLQVGEAEYEAIVNYTMQPELTNYVDGLLTRYKPDYAAVVAMKAETGDILLMTSFVRNQDEYQNLALHSEFPAASIFKIITAVAAIDQGIATPKTLYKYNGKKTSLYKKNVLRHKDNKWTQTVDLRQAFASSINTVFGKMGVFQVGGSTLNDYANQFGFNRPLSYDLQFAPSKTNFEHNNDWAVAETASGYTKSTTMSPLHAALVASAIVNNGIMPEPRIVKNAFLSHGPLLYNRKNSSTRVVSNEVANDMKVLMRATVRKGSARKSFKGFFRGDYKSLDVGGKTGSLTGLNPKGRTEWFVGYGDSGSEKIAVATVIVNKKKWRVKPAYLARKVIEEYFKPNASG